MKNPIRVMSAYPLRGAFEKVIGPRLAERGEDCQVDWAPTKIILEKLQRGEGCDAIFAVSETVEELAASGVIAAGTSVKIVHSSYGVAVRAGAPHPDISTVERFKAALLAARSVAFSLSGASGLYFAGVLKTLGIDEAIRAKATMTPAGFTAERLVSGEADLAIQQISELLVVEGIEIAGPFPAGVQEIIDFSCGITSTAANPEGARTFIEALTDRAAAEIFKATGLEPAFAVPSA